MRSHKSALPRLFAPALTVALATIAAAGQGATFKIVNNCNQTIYPAVLPADYQNGGWSQAPNTTVTFTVPDNFSGRVWGRKNCNTSTSPYQCDTGQCGGTGASCAGTSGWATTSLAEFTLAGTANGTDWYDVSDVDAYDFPIAITTPTGGYSPTATADVLGVCPANLQKVGQVSGKVAFCANPCSVYNTPVVCCTSLSPQNCRDAVNQWPAPAQQYVNAIHNYEGEDYTYPWDDWWGLHTESAGSNPSGNTWTITFCPNNVQPTPGSGADNWPLAPTGIAGTSSGTTVNLTWSGVSGATSYKVYRAVNNGANNATPQDAPIATVTGTAYTDSGLTSGTTYYYVVTAVNSSGYSPPSGQLTIKAGGGQGTAPLPATSSFSASGVSGGVSLSWAAVSGATSYSIFDSTNSLGESSTAVATVTGTSTTITGLTNGTKYYFIVTANNASGNGADSAEAYATAGTSGGGGGTGGGGTTGGGTTGGGTTGGGTSGPISIDAGGPAASPFVADTDYSGGTATSVTATISTSQLTGTIPAQSVLQSNRYGNVTYTIPGLTAGTTYSVTLYFAEEYWTATGKREFNVTANGTTELSNFDIYAAAGGENIAVQKSFNVAANSSGQIVLVFTSVVDNAQVNGIVVASSGGSTSGGAISNGSHTLAPQCATGSRLDDTNGSTTNGNKLQIWAASGGPNQAWTFTNIGGNNYNLAVLGSYCLDSGGTSTNGGAATIWACNGNTNQQWTATAVSGGYTFKDGNAGLCLDVSGAGTANGTAVDTWACNGTAAQTWAVN